MNRQFVYRLPPTGPPHKRLAILCGSPFNVHQRSKRSINRADFVIGRWRVRVWLVVLPVLGERAVVCAVAKFLPLSANHVVQKLPGSHGVIFILTEIIHECSGVLEYLIGIPFCKPIAA